MRCQKGFATAVMVSSTEVIQLFSSTFRFSEEKQSSQVGFPWAPE